MYDKYVSTFRKLMLILS